MKRSVVSAILILFLAGCAASVGVGTSYPVLDTIPPGNAPVPVAQGVRTVVAVGPIGIPGYIIRAATITESNVVSNVSELDLKAAPLAREIPRVITVDMERLLAPKGMVVTSGGPRTDADYRIAVDLKTFEVTGLNALQTQGQWALYKRGSNAPVVVKDVSFTTPIADNSQTAVRAAMSRSLADLATIIVRDFEGYAGAR